MSLKFYKNGMIVQGGPLRPYDDPSTISFLQDILDGYFPSELQQTYPDGVPFKREMTARNSDHGAIVRDGCQKSRQTTRFPNSGRYYHSSADRISKSPNRIQGTEDRIRQRSRSASLPNSRLSITPRNVPRAKVPPIETANSDSSRFSGSQTQMARKNQRPIKSAAPIRKSAAAARMPPILHQINEPTGRFGELRLKVRSLNGGTVFLVHVSADEPIARLYQLLDRALTKTVPRGYKIVVSGYSPKRLDHLGATLREIGITRDSVLHLVND